MVKPKTVLFVDDHTDLAVVFSRMLDRRGYLATPALTVEAALALARLIKYDLVVCDIVFEEKSGYEFLEAFREFSTAPTIAISGVVNHSDRAMTAGFATFLPKPLLLDKLILAIEKALSI